MTSFVPFEPGTIEVTAGSKNIVGTGTDFTAYGDGDTIWVDGYPVLLDGDPVDETHALARFNYLGGSGAGKAYRWVPLPDLSRALALDTRIASYFTSGNLPALAGLTGVADKVPYFTGAGTMDLADFTTDARDLFTRWTRATGLGAAKLALHEDTDNGANYGLLQAPAALGGNYNWILPASDMTFHTYMAGLMNTSGADALRTAVGTNTLYVAKSANYAVVATDRGYLVAVSASGASRTISLLSAATAGAGFEVAVKKTDSSTNTVTIDANGSETIDGSLTYVLYLQGHGVRLRSDGTNWQIIDSHLPPENGSGYIRYASGAQFAWGQISNGSTLTWVYQAQFASNPVPSTVTNLSVGGARLVGPESISTTSITVARLDTAGAASNFGSTYLQASGNWR